MPKPFILSILINCCLFHISLVNSARGNWKPITSIWLAKHFHMPIVHFRKSKNIWKVLMAFIRCRRVTVIFSGLSTRKTRNTLPKWYRNKNPRGFFHHTIENCLFRNQISLNMKGMIMCQNASPLRIEPIMISPICVSTKIIMSTNKRGRRSIICTDVRNRTNWKIFQQNIATYW